MWNVIVEVSQNVKNWFPKDRNTKQHYIKFKVLGNDQGKNVKNKKEWLRKCMCENVIE